MIYFIRREFEENETKALHKQRLREAVGNTLKKAFLEYGVDYSKEEICYNDYGKPYFKNLSDMYFNISHCNQLAVLAIGNSELGIDAENIRKYSPRVAKRAFSEKEAEILEASENKDETFFRIWTLKESFVKAIGIGISYPLKSCQFFVTKSGFEALGCDGYHFSQIILNDSFICSLCVKNAAVKENKFYKISCEDSSFSLKL